MKPLGAITRGTTNPNRLRRVDNWIAATCADLLRDTPEPVVVDLGYGASPVTVVECAVPPVVVNGVGSAPYDTPAVGPYRQVAVSLVVRLSVACVVPAASVPVGSPFDLTGGVVSDGGGSVVPIGVFISLWICARESATL